MGPTQGCLPSPGRRRIKASGREGVLLAALLEQQRSKNSELFQALAESTEELEEGAAAAADLAANPTTSANLQYDNVGEEQSKRSLQTRPGADQYDDVGEEQSERSLQTRPGADQYDDLGEEQSE